MGVGGRNRAGALISIPILAAGQRPKSPAKRNFTENLAGSSLHGRRAKTSDNAARGGKFAAEWNSEFCSGEGNGLA